MMMMMKRETRRVARHNGGARGRGGLLVKAKTREGTKVTKGAQAQGHPRCPRAQGIEIDIGV